MWRRSQYHQTGREVLRRKLTVELLEHRRVLAGNLYGVDFGTNFDAPTNFMGLTDVAVGQTFENVRESGFSITLAGFAQEFDTEDTAPDPATVPTNVLSIDNIDGQRTGLNAGQHDRGG